VPQHQGQRDEQKPVDLTITPAAGFLWKGASSQYNAMNTVSEEKAATNTMLVRTSGIRRRPRRLAPPLH